MIYIPYMIAEFAYPIQTNFKRIGGHLSILTRRNMIVVRILEDLLLRMNLVL
jgi:hypothetical protein